MAGPRWCAAGGLHYLAGWPDEAGADPHPAPRPADREGIETDPLPEGLRRRDTATHRFLFNYNPCRWNGAA